MNYIATALFLFLFIATSANTELLKEGYYAVVYNKSDVLADVRINDIPIITMEKQDSYSGQLEVNYWIFPGKNIITINLNEQKKKEESGFYNPKIKVSLYIGQKGQFPSDGKLIAEYEWPKKITGDEKKTDADKKLVFPVSKTLEFEPEFVPPSDLWKKAESITITPKDEKDIINLLKDFETSFNTRNPEKLYQILEFRGFDSTKSRYYPMTKEQIMKDIKSFNSNNFIKIKNVSNEKYKFTKLFNGQLYLVTESSGKSPLMYVSKDGSGEIEVYVSKIDGKWVLSR
jgi:hypothetical protein